MEKEVSGALVMTDKFACVDSAAIFKARVDTARMNFHRLIYKIFLSNYNNCISTYMLSKYYKSMPIEIGKMLFVIPKNTLANLRFRNGLAGQIRQVKVIGNGAILNALAERTPDRSRGRAGVEIGDEQFTGYRLT